MFVPRFSFLIAVVFVLALIASEVNAGSAKSAKSKSAKSSGKSSKSKSGKSSSDAWDRRVLEDMGDRRLTLQYMTDRFKEEGSVRSFVESFGYEVDLNSGTGEKENVLSKEDCQGLMSLIDHDSFSKVEVQNGRDMTMFIDESELVSIIGKDKFNSLLALHKEVIGANIPLEGIFIAHTHGVANSNAFLEYHTDESGGDVKSSTMLVALNDNSSVKEGGELYYLREDGPVLASRAQGKAFVHSYNVLHGVSPHVGDRTNLVLFFNHELKLEDVGGRKLTEETKRGERVLGYTRGLRVL